MSVDKNNDKLKENVTRMIKILNRTTNDLEELLEDLTDDDPPSIYEDEDVRTQINQIMRKFDEAKHSKKYIYRVGVYVDEFFTEYKCDFLKEVHGMDIMYSLAEFDGIDGTTIELVTEKLKLKKLDILVYKFNQQHDKWWLFEFEVAERL